MSSFSCLVPQRTSCLSWPLWCTLTVLWPSRTPRFLDCLFFPRLPYLTWICLSTPINFPLWFYSHQACLSLSGFPICFLATICNGWELISSSDSSLSLAWLLVWRRERHEFIHVYLANPYVFILASASALPRACQGEMRVAKGAPGGGRLWNRFPSAQAWRPSQPQPPLRLRRLRLRQLAGKELGKKWKNETCFRCHRRVMRLSLFAG